MSMDGLAMLFGGRKRARALVKSLRFITIVTLQFFLATALAQGQAVPPDAQRQALGSLMTGGEVYVNESRAPSELTIFPGDTVRTSETGTAMLTTETKGSYQISTDSQVVFSGDPRYLAELKSGTISVQSTTVGKAVVRAGDFVVVPTVLNSQTVEKIERMADGSFLVTCSLGSIGIVTVQGAQGLFLEAGKSATISANNELVATDQPSQAPNTNPSPAPNQGTAQPVGRSYRTWIYIGLLGGGVAGVAVWAATRGSSPPVVSPAAP